MREILCQMFEAGFMSLSGIKIIKVFFCSLLSYERIINGRTIYVVQKPQLGSEYKIEREETSSSIIRASLSGEIFFLPQIPDSGPSEAPWRGCEENQNCKKDSQTWPIIIIILSVF